MTEIDLIIDLHTNTTRQGPGSEKETLQALEMIDLDPIKELKIADIGCGSGAQTLSLAKATRSEIIAIDLAEPFLKELEQKAIHEELSDRIKTRAESMDKLNLEENSLDIIWSEGAIYSIGFKKGVELWKPFLKPKGFLAVTEITWTTNNRPKAIEEYWTNAYPEIDTASNKIIQLENAGYSLVGYFNLSPISWLENYYAPLEAKFGAFLDKHEHSKLALAVVHENKKEIALYKNYGQYYSYGFYIARNNA